MKLNKEIITAIIIIITVGWVMDDDFNKKGTPERGVTLVKRI